MLLRASLQFGLACLRRQRQRFAILNKIDPRILGQRDLICARLRYVFYEKKPGKTVVRFRLSSRRQHIVHREMRLKLHGEAFVGD